MNNENNPVADGPAEGIATVTVNEYFVENVERRVDTKRHCWGESVDEYELCEAVIAEYQVVKDSLTTCPVEPAAPVVQIERCSDCPRLWDTEGPRCDDCPPLASQPAPVVVPEETEGLRVYFGDINNGKGARSIYLYACLYECETGDLAISADMDYCLEAIKARGWIVEKTGKVKLSAHPAPLPSDQPWRDFVRQLGELTDDSARIKAKILSKIDMSQAGSEEWIWETLAVLEAEGKLPANVGQKETFDSWLQESHPDMHEHSDSWAPAISLMDEAWNAATGGTN